MKSRELIIAMVLLTGCALSASAIAQENTVNKPKHHHYKLVDIGSFGGPQSYVNPGSGNDTGNYAMVLNPAGAVTGSADNATADPFPNSCFNEDCFVSHTFEWKNGHKTDLDALPGGASSAGNWISANGLIAGFSQNGEVDPLIPGLPEVHAALWRNGGITDLGTLPEGGFESIAATVNSRGQVVGLAINTIVDPNSMVGIGFQTRAFLWENGAMQDLGTLGTGTNAQAFLINERGQVVGWSYINSIPTNACNPGFAFVTGSFIWDKENGMRDLGSLGGTCTTASDMNDHGQVVGFSNLPGDLSQHGFLWDNGSFQDLGGSLGGNSQGPFAMNEQGQAVGFATLSGDKFFHAVLWTHVGNLIDLAGSGPVQCSYATSINAKTQVVGTSSDCVSAGHVFLWEDGSMADLNALIPPNSSLFLQFTEAINDRGEIAGTGSDVNGHQHAFVAIPCDENHLNIEGCDYGLVEESAPPDAQGLTSEGPKIDLLENVRELSQRRLAFSRFVKSAQNAASISTALTSTPSAALSPTSLTFSTQAIGTTSAANAITLKNTGATSLTITGIAITGTNAGDFAQTHTCGGSLAAGASCSISATFKPTASGTRTAALSVTDNAAGSPQKVPLSGIGTTAKLSPASLHFAATIGHTSLAKTVTLTNVGATTLTITGITITGTNAGDFAQTHTCASSLAAGASCIISVTFKPTATGCRTAALSVSDNAAGSPQTVALSGGCIPQGGACFGPAGPQCCPAPRGHHSYCSDPTGWGTCTES